MSLDATWPHTVSEQARRVSVVAALAAPIDGAGLAHLRAILGALVCLTVLRYEPYGRADITLARARE